ncbi:sensor histidine kinase [Citrifermentans bremense]|uniref:sensor histidine kinase n=1 Tax=Citrifermentans bremense TaxID=60035 RepID=UPI000422E9FF|nr:sensor histidine kinase [Citrifermentans bremense]
MDSIKDIQNKKKTVSKKQFPSDRKLHNLLQHVPVVLFQYQKHGDGRHSFPYISDGFTKLFHVRSCKAPTDASGFFSKLHCDDVGIVIASLADSAENLSLWQQEFRIKMERQYWIEAAATPILLKDGSCLWSGYAREISERKVLEQDLRKAKEDLMRLIEERTHKLTKANTQLHALNQEIREEIDQRVKLEKSLKESYELLSLLAANLVFSEERERRRIATELHDDVVQHLALCKLRLDMGLKDGTPSRVLQEELVGELVRTMQQIRRICYDLSPPVLYDFGILKALQNLGETMTQAAALQFSFQHDQEKLELPNHICTVLYQTAKELLTNVIKHATASQILVTITKSDELVRLSVTDDGVGFLSSCKKGFGLSHIQQRVAFLKGNLSISSGPDKKTVVTVEIPAPGPN